MSTVLDFTGLPPSGFTARVFRVGDEADATAVREFCRSCSAFFTLVASEPGADETARNLLEGRPLSIEPERKHVIGILRGDKCVAIADLLEDFPKPTEWYVGLLLLAPEERNHGLGTAIWSAMEAWMLLQGVRRIRLIVQEQNPRAAQFWRGVGFHATGQVEQVLGSRTNLCWRFEKDFTVSPQPTHES